MREAPSETNAGRIPSSHSWCPPYQKARQRQLQERVLQLTTDRHTLESNGGEGGPESGTTVAIYGVGRETLAPHLLAGECPLIWRAPKIPLYKGDTYPKDHLHAFRTNMEDRTGHKDIWCRMVRRALKGDAIAWYKTLSAGAIHTYGGDMRTWRRRSRWSSRTARGGRNSRPPSCPSGKGTSRVLTST